MSSPGKLLAYARKMHNCRQEVLADSGAFLQLADLLLKQNKRRILLLSGKQTQKLKLYDQFVDILQNGGAKVFIWVHEGKLPERAAVDKCAVECQTYNCDAIVAFGGGTIIDMAKMVSVRMTNPYSSLYQMRGVDCIYAPGVDLYVVSTTGSGAEGSACALIRQYQYISMYYSRYLIPKTVVLDPDLVLRLPMENMASAAILALTHAVEAYISPVSEEFPADRANVLISLPIFFSYLEKCYKHGVDNDTYLQIMMAPYYAGVAARRIGFGYTHSFAMYMADRYDMAPGCICATMLPVVLEYELDEVKDDLAELARAAHLCSSRATSEEAARAFISGFQSLCRRVGLDSKSPAIQNEDVPDLAELVLNDAKQWRHPKKMKTKQAAALLRKVQNGKKG